MEVKVIGSLFGARRDPPPPLKKEDRDKIVDWFTDRGHGNHHCSVCATNEWALGTHLAYSPLVEIGEGVAINHGYAFVVLVCVRCAHTLFFAANPILGLSPSSEKPTTGVGHAD